MSIVINKCKMKKISKSKIKPNLLQFLRQVEQSGEELIITDRGIPVLKIIPYSEDTEKHLKDLKGTVMKFDNPTAPVGLQDWEALK